MPVDRMRSSRLTDQDSRTDDSSHSSTKTPVQNDRQSLWYIVSKVLFFSSSPELEGKSWVHGREVRTSLTMTLLRSRVTRTQCLPFSSRRRTRPAFFCWGSVGSWEMTWR